MPHQPPELEPPRPRLSQDEITRWLELWRQDSGNCLDEAPVAALYDRLRRKAAALLDGGRRGQTLDTSALVHESFLRLAEQRHVEWQNRAHFLALAARMMRRILANRTRDRKAAKRSGDQAKVSFVEARHAGPASDLLADALEEGLQELARSHPAHAEVVELRYFGGLTREEIAEVCGTSVPTVGRRWALARAWLHRYLRTGRTGPRQEK